MKKVLSLLVFTMFVFYTSTTHAEASRPYEIVRDWSKGSTVSRFLESRDGFNETWLTEIVHSSNGRQYLSFQKMDGFKSTCTPYKSESDMISSTWQFNGRSIQMVEWCLKYSDSNNSFLMAAIKTEEGESWVHDLFKKSDWVEIKQGRESKVRISGIDFSKNWSEAGGNAL
ncbi:hypothetical protein LMH66_14800 [Shewanella sp. 10N.7]|uniref:hypothetical protein n=1 Tax=Shewanella sp. 10N.7 TaxID=2885093 RepID=UPI001E449F26|nr:hypothetical protein [Shewanella sp. 10N.7]MCC4833911.1 hypothetical protein [Shewanella sp. 10N.7]